MRTSTRPRPTARPRRWRPRRRRRQNNTSGCCVTKWPHGGTGAALQSGGGHIGALKVVLLKAGADRTRPASALVLQDRTPLCLAFRPGFCVGDCLALETTDEFSSTFPLCFPRLYQPSFVPSSSNKMGAVDATIMHTGAVMCVEHTAVATEVWRVVGVDFIGRGQAKGQQRKRVARRVAVNLTYFLSKYSARCVWQGESLASPAPLAHHIGAPGRCSGRTLYSSTPQGTA